MINSYNDKLQYRDREIIILGCPKINNLFILILIPRPKLLWPSSLFERYRRFNQVLETLFRKKCRIEILQQLLHYPLTSSEIEARDLYEKRVGLLWLPLERGPGHFFTGFHFSGTTTPISTPAG